MFGRTDVPLGCAMDSARVRVSRGEGQAGQAGQGRGGEGQGGAEPKTRNKPQVISTTAPEGALPEKLLGARRKSEQGTGSHSRHPNRAWGTHKTESHGRAPKAEHVVQIRMAHRMSKCNIGMSETFKTIRFKFKVQFLMPPDPWNKPLKDVSLMRFSTSHPLEEKTP